MAMIAMIAAGLSSSLSSAGGAAFLYLRKKRVQKDVSKPQRPRPRYLEVVGSGVLDLDAVGSDVLDLDAVGSGVLDLDALDLDAVDPGEQLEDLNLNQKLRN
jgi:signal transduction histidine kinase